MMTLFDGRISRILLDLLKIESIVRRYKTLRSVLLKIGIIQWLISVIVAREKLCIQRFLPNFFPSTPEIAESLAIAHTAAREGFSHREGVYLKPFLYPRKTENRKVLLCFQGVEKGYIGNNNSSGFFLELAEILMCWKSQSFFSLAFFCKELT